jgi:hypothetical protein
MLFAGTPDQSARGAVMTRFQTRYTGCAVRAALLGLLVAAPQWALALDAHLSGRISFGTVYRTEARDPQLLTGVNAAAAGLQGFGSGGNADDANTNYGRGDAVSRALKAYFDFTASAGDFSTLVRLKAWHDYGLLDDARPWGNVPSAYAANSPLSDRGAPVLSRFSGVAFQEAWVQQRMQLGDARLLARIGQQNLDWGNRFATPGGLEALNPKDLPALHRAGAVPQETRVALPMLFGRLELASAFRIEGYYQGAFRPNALDMCGTVWSLNDYITGGCDKVMSGQPQVSDRARLPLGAFMKRLPTPKPEAAEFGIGLTWKPQPGTELGLYQARYNARAALPSLRRSTRVGGPALVAGDPDGRNMAYFSEYPEGLSISALSVATTLGQASLYGELSYRPRTPFMLSPGDVLPPFLSASAPSLLRSSADAVPPGGVFHGFDLYAMQQAQLGVRRELELGAVGLTAGAEVVAKHTPGLPDQAVRRYGRADIFGVGPIFGTCNANTGNPARQCSLRGYVTADAWAYRLRLDARLPALLPGFASSASLAFAHDVKGWSGDLLINQGRKTAALGLRLEYLQRYVADISWMPTWGGDYNQVADRDLLALSVGVKF